jgi:hypothetical protein
MTHQASDPRWDQFAELIAARVIAKLPERARSLPEWMTPKQAAEYIGRTVKALSHLRAVTRGPRFSKVGKIVRYRRADLDAWLEQHKIESAA